MKPRVFLLEPTRLDITGLHRHGELRYIFREDTPRPSIWDDEYVRVAINRMRDLGYDPKRDYVAIVGNVACLVMLTTALAQVYPNCQVLYFSAPTREYVTKHIGLQETAA